MSEYEKQPEIVAPTPERQRAVEPLFPSGKEPYTPRPNFERASRRRRRVAMWLLALAMAGAAYCGANLLNSAASRGIAAVATQSSARLILSPAEKDAERTREVREALQAGQVPEAARGYSPEIQKEIISGKRELYSIHVLDTQDEDGDMVRLSVNGQEAGLIPLSHKGSTVWLPLEAGTTATVKVDAVQDGGGGVTFGAVTSQSKTITRRMQVGETEAWTVQVK